MELRIPRELSFVDGTGAPEAVTTMAGTVGALLTERGVRLGVDDVSVPPAVQESSSRRLARVMARMRDQLRSERGTAETGA